MAVGPPVLQRTVVVDIDEAVVGEKHIDVDGTDDIHLAMVRGQEEIGFVERSRIDSRLNDIEEPLGVKIDALRNQITENS